MYCYEGIFSRKSWFNVFNMVCIVSSLSYD